MISIFNDQKCVLGEGPLWHPEAGHLFWFDILRKKIFQTVNGVISQHKFHEYVSAAGWIDQKTLIIASETFLSTFNFVTGQKEHLAKLENDNPRTRSNDGRADPHGGFWIGTMAKDASKGQGAIYRYYGGELRQLFAPITISNSICFSVDGLHAYFADTVTHKIMKWPLNEKNGWPVGEPYTFIDLSTEGLFPDGSIVDELGYLWNAQWGAGRVARYSPSGTYVDDIAFPASQITCPAFGGEEMKTLFVTSASLNLKEPEAGRTFTIETEFRGQKEHSIRL